MRARYAPDSGTPTRRDVLTVCSLVLPANRTSVSPERRPRAQTESRPACTWSLMSSS